MAKASNLNARLISLKEETDQLKANELQLQKLYALEDKITDAQFKKVEALEAQNKVLQKSKLNFNEEIDKIQFKLLLVPTNTEGDEVTEGIVEEVDILFDKGDLRLNRGKVVSDIREAFHRNFNTKIFEDEISNLNRHFRGSD